MQKDKLHLLFKPLKSTHSLEIWPINDIVSNGCNILEGNVNWSPLKVPVLTNHHQPPIVSDWQQYGNNPNRGRSFVKEWKNLKLRLDKHSFYRHKKHPVSKSCTKYEHQLHQNAVCWLQLNIKYNLTNKDDWKTWVQQSTAGYWTEFWFGPAPVRL